MPGGLSAPEQRAAGCPGHQTCQTPEPRLQMDMYEQQTCTRIAMICEAGKG